tara:strand:+ start:401 stop:595 length:195 start_codon:yes stop_codon:yes gene_type:complete
LLEEEEKVDKVDKEYLSDSLSLSFFPLRLSVWFYYQTRILLKERARSDDDDDHAFDRENRGGCV